MLREEDDEIMGPRRPDCEERRAYGAPAGPAGARSMNLKNGHAKRTRLELEYKVYTMSRPTMERPPPYM